MFPTFSSSPPPRICGLLLCSYALPDCYSVHPLKSRGLGSCKGSRAGRLFPLESSELFFENVLRLPTTLPRISFYLQLLRKRLPPPLIQRPLPSAGILCFPFSCRLWKPDSFPSCSYGWPSGRAVANPNFVNFLTPWTSRYPVVLRRQPFYILYTRLKRYIATNASPSFLIG